MKVDRKMAEKSLKAKGFRRDPSHDHVYFFHVFDGKETGIKTYFSHSANYKDIGPDNLTSMMKQLKLKTIKEARELLECTMSGDDYNSFLKNLGYLVSDGSA
ncbi:MAG: hypothetical protein WCJ75_08165 [Desulfomonile sp.]|jgi:hypothetical protein